MTDLAALEATATPETLTKDVLDAVRLDRRRYHGGHWDGVTHSHDKCLMLARVEELEAAAARNALPRLLRIEAAARAVLWNIERDHRRCEEVGRCHNATQNELAHDLRTALRDAIEETP